jgi:hypothetical protein
MFFFLAFEEIVDRMYIFAFKLITEYLVIELPSDLPASALEIAK